MTPTLDYNAGLFAFLQTSLSSFQDNIQHAGGDEKLMEVMRPGDTLVFADRRAHLKFTLTELANQHHHLIARLHFSVVDPTTLHLPGQFHGIQKGTKIHFHHTWLDAFWLHAIHSANRTVTLLDDRLKELTRNLEKAE
jgi:hypothetical protein